MAAESSGFQKFCVAARAFHAASLVTGIGNVTRRYANRPYGLTSRPAASPYPVETRKFEAYPDDLEVRAVFAESIMNETPWNMWDLRAGKPAEGAGTEECRVVLEHAFNSIPIGDRCVSSATMCVAARRAYLARVASSPVGRPRFSCATGRTMMDAPVLVFENGCPKESGKTRKCAAYSDPAMPAWCTILLHRSISLSMKG
jgi:hypothetical protein